MTKQEIIDYLISHGWQLSKRGNPYTHFEGKTRYGFPTLERYTVTFNKAAVELRKEDQSIVFDNNWAKCNPVIAKSKLLGVQLREDGTICIDGVVIK